MFVLHELMITPTADMYRGIFKYGVFNAVQSKCWDTVRLLAISVYVLKLTIRLPVDVRQQQHGASRRARLFRTLIFRLLQVVTGQYATSWFHHPLTTSM